MLQSTHSSTFEDSMGRLHILVSLAACATAVLYAPDSNACQPPLCTKAYAAPAQGTILTSSAPAVFFRPSRINAPATDAGVEGVTLWSDGQQVPLTITEQSYAGQILAPSIPLTAGSQYELHYVEQCPDSPSYPLEPASIPVVQEFTAGPPRPSPTAVGTVAVKSRSKETLTVLTSSGSCTTTLLAGVVNLELTFDESIKPFLPTTKLITRVDGNEWSSTQYGVDEGTLSTQPQATYGRRYNLIFGACQAPAQSGDDVGLTMGKHTVELSAHVAGAQTDPAPVSIEVDLTCDQVPSTPDGGAADASGTAESGSSEDTGCHAASAPGGASWWTALMLMGAVALLRRRRG